MTSVFIFNDTRVDAHHGCQRVMTNICKCLTANGLNVVGFAPAHKDWRGNAELAPLIESADIMLVNGEGTLHHDRPAGAHLLAVASMAKAKGKHSALINATWDSNGSAYIEALRLFDLVSVREKSSQEELKRHNIDSLCVPDMSTYGDTCIFPARTERIGFVDSVLPGVTPALYKMQLGMQGRMLPIHYAHHGIKGELAYARSLLSSCQPNSVASWRVALSFWLSSRFGSIPNSDDYIQALAEHRGVVTGRFHAVCMALLARTPFIAIESNTFKISSLIRDVGLSERRVVTSAEQITPAYLQELLPWQEHELLLVNNYVDQAQNQIDALFRRIARISAEAVSCP